MNYFITTFYGRARGGVGRYEEELLPRLQQRIEIEPLAPSSIKAPAVVQSFGQVFNRDINTILGNIRYRVPKLPKDSIVHVSSQFVASVLAFNRFEKSVITLFDVITLAMPTELDFLSRQLNSWNIRSCKKAKHIITISEHARADILHHLNLSEEQVTAIPLGIDHATYYRRDIEPEFYEQLGLSSSIQYVAYIGSKHKRKNLEMLCEAMQVVVRDKNDVKLVIREPEDNPEGAAFKEWVARYQLEPYVHYVPFLSSEQLAKLMNIAAVLVLPSVYEGFGLTALEAMACGTPVVASNMTSIPEVVGDAGILLDPRDAREWANAISGALSNKKLHQELSARGMQRAAQFTWEKTADQTIEVYQRL